MKNYYVNIYPEICCELCNEVQHNHFDCPICKTENVGTDRYIELKQHDIFSCDSCNSTFEILSKHPYLANKCKVKFIN